MDDYGKKVQSRIDKLTRRLRETERREQAAIQYAQGVQADSSRVRQQAAQINSGYVAEFGDRVASQMAEAKKELKEAMDLGDTEKQVEVQAKLSRLELLPKKLKESDCREKCKQEELIQINLKCQHISHQDLKHPLHRTQKLWIGLKRTNGLEKMNQ